MLCRHLISSGFTDFADHDILSELFRRGANNARGPDVHYHLPIEFLEAITGETKRLTLPEGGTLDVTIPAGIQDGQVLRLRGKGRPGVGEGEAGDALVEIAVKPHRFFTREGNNIYLELPVTLSEAILGALENAIDIRRRETTQINDIGPICDQAAARRE
jgi:DnaJ-class molecular chaperone